MPKSVVKLLLIDRQSSQSKIFINSKQDSVHKDICALITLEAKRERVSIH